MKSPKIKCSNCNGRGVVELTGVYRETFELLRRQRSELNGADLAKLAGCEATAMSNRLVVLEKHGLASHRKFGREKLWRAVPWRGK